uniref:Exostosin GT47 domain-containing protein n=1 Tax=Haptolina brevifila TaxID=156173 RepID=A0A7S2JPK8_9EUKA|mmetsp:Transcript_86031/g.171813  ORF Transcript_86031/g.171813 Transcript_86031/m.171813 type:complete len:302 (+) Transcript_86031:121-1026(+)
MDFFVFEPEERAPQGWFKEVLAAVGSRCAPTLSEAAFIIVGIDPMNAHWPAYANILRHRGGPEAFFLERQRRIDDTWVVLQRLLPSLTASQRVLLFDVESSHVPSSASIHSRKRQLPCAAQFVHISIASSIDSYRPGIDLSFPGVIPESLGDEGQASVPPSKRPFLFSFKGVHSHPVRAPLYALHNGRDQICIDCSKERNPTELRRQLGLHDDEYADLSARSRFVLCPTGDDVYSFRFVEALSCGAVPVIFVRGAESIPHNPLPTSLPASLPLTICRVRRGMAGSSHFRSCLILITVASQS